MTPSQTVGSVLDTGALIAFERRDLRMTRVLDDAIRLGAVLVVPAGVVSQAWRDGARQARLAAFLRARPCQIVPHDAVDARAAGRLLGLAGTTDVVDASVAVVARRLDLRVVTSDPDDIRRLDPTLDVIAL